MSIGYGLTQTDFFFGFVNAIGAFSIAAIFVAGFVFLEQFGYFDVFGYTFKKTYLVMTNKHKDLDEDDKVRMQSMFAYAQDKHAKRVSPSKLFYLYCLGLVIVGITLSYLYIYLN